MSLRVKLELVLEMPPEDISVDFPADVSDSQILRAVSDQIKEVGINRIPKGYIKAFKVEVLH